MSTEHGLTRWDSASTGYNAPEVHTFRLSSLDQSLARTYVRYCLCFPCNTESHQTIDTVSARLNVAVRRAITHLPLLAGSVYPERASEPSGISVNALQSIIDAGCAKQQGRLEVRVTLKEVNGFKAATRNYVEKPTRDLYSRLHRDRMPPAWLMQPCFTPFAGEPDANRSSVFAIKSSFISGGLLVALYLHNSVADIHGLSTIMRLMSSDMPSRKLSDEDLEGEAMAWALGRQPLSSSHGVTATVADHPGYMSLVETEVSGQSDNFAGHGRCHILSFKLSKIEQVRELVNKRRQMRQRGILGRAQQIISITSYECLAAVLWQAINRGRWPDGNSNQGSTLVMPTNTRKTIVPPLNDDYFGNATVNAMASCPISKLVVKYDITTLTRATSLIRDSITRINDKHVRSAIAVINECDDVRSLNTPNIDVDTDMTINSWADLPTYDADLGLGLGAAQWGRKISQAHSVYDCTILPVRKAEGTWEVMLELADGVMDNLLRDEGLSSFVDRVI